MSSIERSVNIHRLNKHSNQFEYSHFLALSRSVIDFMMNFSSPSRTINFSERLVVQILFQMRVVNPKTRPIIHKHRQDFLLRSSSADSGCEEEEESCDSGAIVDICQRFCENSSVPTTELSELSNCGDDLEGISADSIEQLERKGFFATFGNRSLEFDSPEEIVQILTVLDHFLLYSTKVCLSLLTARMVHFLRRQLFSHTLLIRKLALQCLESLSGDSGESRQSLCNWGFVSELCSLVLSPIDTDCSNFASELICTLCSCDLAGRHLDLLSKVALFLLNKGNLVHSSRILLFVAESHPRPYQLFCDARFAAHFLPIFCRNQDNEHFVLFSLKFLTIRMDFVEEAEVFVGSGLFETLLSVLSANSRPSKWICWVIGNALQSVPGSIENFFVLGLFDFVEHMIESGDYEAKSAASMVIVRIVKQRLILEFVQEERVMRLLIEMMELLESGSQRTIRSILSMALDVARLEESQGCRGFLDALACENCGQALEHVLEGEFDDCSLLAGQLLEMMFGIE
jgi:hypothetical protein